MPWAPMDLSLSHGEAKSGLPPSVGCSQVYTEAERKMGMKGNGNGPQKGVRPCPGSSAPYPVPQFPPCYHLARD